MKSPSSPKDQLLNPKSLSNLPKIDYSIHENEELEITVKEEIKENLKDKENEKIENEKIESHNKLIEHNQILQEEIKFKKKRRLFFIALINITTSITANLSFFLVETLNIAFLGHEGNLTLINATQLGTIYLNTCGYIFCLGAMNAFDSIGAQNFADKKYLKLYNVYNHNKILTLLIYLIIMLPLGFTSNHILEFIQIENELIKPSSTYITICLISLIISLYNQINYKFLQIMKKQTLVLILNLVGLCLHFLNCMCFIFTFKLGIIGAGISMIVTSILNYFLSTFFLLKYNPCEGKSLIEMDTDSLISSKFYTYAKLALTSGLYMSIELFAFDVIIFASSYMDIESMTSNIIILNYLSIMWIFSYGIAGTLTQRIGKYIAHTQNQINNLFIKYDIIIGIIITVCISAMTFMFAYSIPNIYVDDIIVINNVGYVLRWYSLFIFFDFIFNIINGAIKGIQKHSEINLICSLILLLIFIPLGLLFSFEFGYGFLGFWMSTFISMIVFSILFGGYLVYLIEKIWESKDRRYPLYLRK